MKSYSLLPHNQTIRASPSKQNVIKEMAKNNNNLFKIKKKIL